MSFISYLLNIALRNSTGKLMEIGMTNVSRKANRLWKSLSKNSMGPRMMSVGCRASKEATVWI